MTEIVAADLLGDLDAGDWARVRDAVEQAGNRLKMSQVENALKADVANRLLRLASHPKWEVRKAVAHASLYLRHEAFHAVIARIVEDENVWVRETARKTAQRRDGLDLRAVLQGDPDQRRQLVQHLEQRRLHERQP